MDNKFKSVLMLLIAVSQNVSAKVIDINTVPCRIIRAIIYIVETVGFGLVALMIIYGGVKYTFSADDPSGRKQGKDIVIQAIIGAVLLMIWTAIKDLIEVAIPWLDWSCIP